MIIDKLENIHYYKELFPELFDYIQNEDLYSLSLGKHEISEKLFVLVNEYETNNNNIDILENHKKYIDFQIVISGSENVSFSKTFITRYKQYDHEADYELVKAIPIFLNFEAGSFMVFFPKEYHHPGIAIKEPLHVKKIVFKIKI